MQTLKKVFSSFVSMTTILWSVGGTLAFPGVASAATLNSGDLIKASGPAVYYYASNGKRYVFPNEKTYFTWYSGFSTVKTITDAELAAIMIGGNVTYRPGVKMVKITTDPKVYAVAKGGVLRHVPSEACATTLYGSNWNTQIEDVPDGFFVNYSVGAAINSSCSDFNKTNEMNSAPTINDSMGTGTSSPINGSVSVALASDTAAGVTLPQGASSVALLKVNLTAGSAEAMVTGLTLKRVGVGTSSDFTNVYLYDSNGTRITTGRSINSSANTVQFNSLNLTIPAGSSKSLVLVGDVGTSLTAGSQHAFEVSDAASVVITGTGTVGGSFPVRGNTFTIGSTTASSITVTKGTTPANPNVGQKDVEISNFKLAAGTNDIEVRRVTLLQAGDISNADLTNLTLWQGSTQVASAPVVIGDKIVLNFNPPFVVTNGQTKTFSLHGDVAGRSGRTIKTYVEYTTDVYAVDTRFGTGAQVDIGTSGTFDGSTSGSKFITVTTQGGQVTVAFNGPAAGNIAKASQDVKLYKFSLTSSDNQLEFRRMRFILESLGDGGVLKSGTTDLFTDIKVIDTDSGATVMGPTSLATGITSSTALTFTDSFTLNAGQTRNFALTADLANNSLLADKQYRACLSDNANGSTVPVAAGTATLLCGDASDAIFQSGDVKITNTGENLDVTKIVPNTSISGNTMTVRTSSLSVALAGSPSSGTAVKKQANIPAVGFVFTAGSESSVLVRAVKLTGVGAFSANVFNATTTASVINSCSLFNGSTQVGTSQSPDTTAGTMNFTNLNVNIPAGSSVTLTAKCTADSVVQGSADYFALGILTASTDITAEDQDSNTISSPSLSASVTANAGATPTVFQTVQAGGVLSVLAGSQPVSTIVVGGQAKKFAEFTATAQNEDIQIDRVTVTSTGYAANFTGVSVRVAGSDVGSDVLSSGLSQYKDVTFSSPVTVTNGQSVTLELWGTMANTAASSTVSGSSNAPRSGNSVSLGLAAGVTASPWDSNYTSSVLNVYATGKASGDRLYAAGSSTVGNSMVLRRTKPTITKLAVSTALTSGADTELYKFQVTPDAGGSVAIKQIGFTVTTSSAVTLSSFKLYKGSTPLTSNSQVSIVSSVGADLTNGGVPTNGLVIVRFVTEEVVTGSGTVYTLRATPTYSGSSATVTTSFTRAAASDTGYLAAAAGTVQIGLDTAAAADGSADTQSAFLWSDNSEVPHSYTTGTSSSRDWATDFYLEDMTQSQTLTQ
jgi:hypothetical protein